MQIGIPVTKQKNTLSYILSHNDSEVFPMSVSYSYKEKFIMKITRFVTLLFLFYLFVPLDLYLPFHARIGYFGTDTYYKTVMFSDIPDNSFYFKLTNCKINWLPPKSDNTDRFDLEFGFLFNTEFVFNSSYLQINSDKTTETCIVNLYLPSQVSLPLFVFHMKGDNTNIQLDDSRLNGASLNFSSGL